MPPAGSLILSIPLFLGFRSIFQIVGYPDATIPFFAAFVIGYLCYDYIHYGVHHFKPTSRIGKIIKQHHMLHHFVDHDAKWGVSTPIWDYFLGTVKAPQRASQQASMKSSSAPSSAK